VLRGLHSLTLNPPFQVSAKGGVSLYGMRRFPITFYKEVWERILAMSDEIREFMGANASALKTKGREE
jgi:hypothetical protein